MTTPANATIRRFGAHSALKSIQCTTPTPTIGVDEALSNRNNPDELPHIVIVRVEKEKDNCKNNTNGGYSGAQLRIEFSSVPLPPSFAMFDCASLKWETETNLEKSLYVCSCEGHSLKLVKLLVQDCGFASSAVDFLSTHSIQAVLAELVGLEEKWSFKVKGISMDISLDRSKEKSRRLEIRLLLHRHPTYDENSSAISSPINVSSTEATRISLLACSIPSAPAQQVAPSRLDSIAGENNQHDLTRKLDQILNFMRSFEKNVDSKMNELERRLSRLEESLRTV